MGDAGVHVVRTPFRAPNANAHAERFVRSIKHECLTRIVPFGESHFRRALAESWIITIGSGITRDSTIDLSIGSATGRPRVRSAGARDSAAC